MFNVLLVDDETIVRSSLDSMFNWEEEGFHIAGSASNGQVALKILQTESIDLMFTDIKMPVMDGIELIQKAEELRKPPLIIVLSAYSEFPLVRHAFRLGAYDYILKSNITPEYIRELLRAVRPWLRPHETKEAKSSSLEGREILKSMALGSMQDAAHLLPQEWRVAQIEIENFRDESLRFGNELESSLVTPMIGLAQQIPRVASKCVISAISFSQFVILFTSPDSVEQAQSICLQVQKVWKDYMNLSTTAGISGVGTKVEEFQSRIQESYNNLTLKFIFGAGGAFTPVEALLFDVKKALNRQGHFQPLLDGLRSMSSEQLMDVQQSLFAEMYQGTLEEARTMVLEVLYNLQLQMADVGANMWSVFNSGYNTDFYQKVRSLTSLRDAELMLSGIIQWLRKYLESTQISARVDVIEKAKEFISVHYTDPELHLSAVAAHAGLSEKYFSSRFNKETGKSFVSYLTDLRLAHAKQLILKTNMKMYEISDMVGFASPEHFTRVFKKTMKISPGKYQRLSKKM